MSDSSRTPDTTMDAEAIRRIYNVQPGSVLDTLLSENLSYRSRLEARERELAEAKLQRDMARAVAENLGTERAELRSQNAEMMRVVEVVELWANHPETWTSDGDVARAVREYRARASRPTETAPTQEVEE